MADGNSPRDPAWDMTEEELVRTYAWARNGELRRIEAKLTEAACALIHTRARMIDEDHDAYHIVNLIEDALIDAGGRLGKVLEAIDPEGEERQAEETESA